jgi:hypothetical protein
MTHHNQTQSLTSWFLNLPLNEFINNKSIKFEVRIQNPMKHSEKNKSQRKAQKWHLLEGKVVGPTKGMKNGKPSQNDKKS